MKKSEILELLNEKLKELKEKQAHNKCKINESVNNKNTILYEYLVEETQEGYILAIQIDLLEEVISSIEKLDEEAEDNDED